MKQACLLMVCAAFALPGCSQRTDTPSAAVQDQSTVDPGAAQRAQAAFDKAAIDDVLRQDQGWTGTNDPQATVNFQSGIDLSKTPGPFHEAYVENTQAWRHYASLKNQWTLLATDDAHGRAVVLSGLCTLLDCDGHPIQDQIDAEDRLKSAIAAASDHINATQENIERVAATYGASMPRAPAAVAPPAGNMM